MDSEITILEITKRTFKCLMLTARHVFSTLSTSSRIFETIFFMQKKIVYPEFTFEVGGTIIKAYEGYLSWHDIHNGAILIYDKDSTLNGNLRKAPKLTYRALHPGNNKKKT